jgi:hypothetical protein
VLCRVEQHGSVDAPKVRPVDPLWDDGKFAAPKCFMRVRPDKSETQAKPHQPPRRPGATTFIEIRGKAWASAYHKKSEVVVNGDDLHLYYRSMSGKTCTVIESIGPVKARRWQKRCVVAIDSR